MGLKSRKGKLSVAIKLENKPFFPERRTLWEEGLIFNSKIL